MVVDGLYMARQARHSAGYVRAYGECVLGDVMPAFADLEKRADKVAEAEFGRLGSRPVGEDCDGDMGTAAEAAQEKGQAFYDTMASLRQTALNLFTTGLFHVLEQQLADLCRDGAFLVPPPNNTKLDVVADWYNRHFDLDLRSLHSWATIDGLRLVANVVKHGEGGSAVRLRGRRPDLFPHPLACELRLDDSSPPVREVRLPLAGDDLYVTDEFFQQYSQAANTFMTDVVGYFDAHGAEYYPRD